MVSNSSNLEEEKGRRITQYAEACTHIHSRDNIQMFLAE